MDILHKKTSGEYVAIKVGLILNCPRYALLFSVLEKKEILRKGPVSLLKISLWSGFQFLLAQTGFLRKWNIHSKWVIPKN